MIAAARRRRKEATVAAMAGPHGKLTHPAPPSLDSSQKWSCRDLANLTRPSAARVRGRSSRNMAIDAMAAPPALRRPNAAAWAQTCNLGSNRAKLLGMVSLVVPAGSPSLLSLVGRPSSHLISGLSNSQPPPPARVAQQRLQGGRGHATWAPHEVAGEAAVHTAPQTPSRLYQLLYTKCSIKCL